ncbi:MAG: (Fe-S)-binding protein [Methanotrichaceae archaeon]
MATKMTVTISDIVKLLPGNNCGECGYKNCREFAQALIDGNDLNLCPFLTQTRFAERAIQIEKLLPKIRETTAEIRGVIDGLEADFVLAPLPGESSCQEDLHPFDRDLKIEVGDVMRYRPLGCPITHFGQVLKLNHGLVTVQMVGPRHLLGDENFHYQDVGICLVTAFEGIVSEGRVPDVGETIRFLPHHCMMQKVHSGVIVHSEGKMVRIESIDLKVW